MTHIADVRLLSIDDNESHQLFIPSGQEPYILPSAEGLCGGILYVLVHVRLGVAATSGLLALALQSCQTRLGLSVT